MWVMRVYIVRVKTWWNKYAKITKQNVSQVFMVYPKQKQKQKKKTKKNRSKMLELL